MKLTSAEENYLFTIHYLSDGSNVSTNQLAQKMGVAAASVTDMIQKLADKDFVKYEKYRGVSLRPNGVKIAKEMNKTKELWQTFLLDWLNISEKETTRLLEDLQHIQSKELKTKFEAFIQSEDNQPNLFSTLTAEEILAQEPQHSKDDEELSDAKVNQTYILKGIKEINEDLLAILSVYQLKIGSSLTILNRIEFDNSLLIAVNDENIILSNKVANLFLVKPL